MIATTEENEILTLLKGLPLEKLVEVKDFVLFLKSRYQTNIDYSTEWTDEDLADFTNASLRYFDQDHED